MGREEGEREGAHFFLIHSTLTSTAILKRREEGEAQRMNQMKIYQAVIFDGPAVSRDVFSIRSETAFAALRRARGWEGGNGRRTRADRDHRGRIGQKKLKKGFRTGQGVGAPVSRTDTRGKMSPTSPHTGTPKYTNAASCLARLPY